MTLFFFLYFYHKVSPQPFVKKALILIIIAPRKLKNAKKQLFSHISSNMKIEPFIFILILTMYF